MKRIGNLYEKVCSIENLQLADEKARKGKLRTYGVIEHDKNREANLLKLRPHFAPRYNERLGTYLGFDLHGGHL